ncbi:methyl-coenzyme M reductase operon protein D [Candidatus Methanoperedens nitroreducens]|uniref:Methyl-coenzyme M reductase operon protein D n=1 Tax=Candidatus Methanoperedens nitratireducens TaxID=1392998 RepID=A0A062V0J7_9EURY|nr:methyl-coenzyme M reductase operon protein D [Candidatus Methanoperedens nitroreducens]KCZ72671.1 methyl-coenzyme M reductase operon protein D [Candidatus Methanoperedens nitroreducens]MDJ1423397.1 methyl-coenzyme M reductase operon protein D [Candidatus Methanoperedens sp.]
MVNTASVTDKPIQIRVFPKRLLQPETAEKLLNEIDQTKGVIRMLLNGKNLPRKVTCGPGTGADVNHPDRMIINVGGCAFELHIIVGEVIVEVENESAMEDVKKACERALPFPFEFKRGHFIKRRPTLTDYGKYGFRSKTDERINLEDERILGLIDPHAKAETNLCVIDTEKK